MINIDNVWFVIDKCGAQHVFRWAIDTFRKSVMKLLCIHREEMAELGGGDAAILQMNE